MVGINSFDCTILSINFTHFLVLTIISSNFILCKIQTPTSLSTRCSILSFWLPLNKWVIILCSILFFFSLKRNIFNHFCSLSQPMILLFLLWLRHLFHILFLSHVHILLLLFRFFISNCRVFLMPFPIWITVTEWLIAYIVIITPVVLHNLDIPWEIHVLVLLRQDLIVRVYDMWIKVGNMLDVEELFLLEGGVLAL